MLLGMAMKWPEVAILNEEVLSIVPAPDRLKGLRDGIIDWSRTLGRAGGATLQKSLEDQGLSDIAKNVTTWASASPALQDKSPEQAADLFQKILIQGKPQYKAWSIMVESKPAPYGLEGAVHGASVERRGGYQVSQIREPVQAPSFG